jgi:hypothetical protein
MRKTALLAAFILFLSLSPVNKVMADGQYGQGGGSSTTEQPKEETTHQTVEAGRGDNLLVLAGFALGSATILLALSKLTRRVYLLD